MSASGLAAHLSPAELGQRYRAARSPVERSHLRIVWLPSRGRGEREVARVTGHGRRWVGEVARRYDEGGPDGLGARRRRNVGAKPLLYRAHEMLTAGGSQGKLVSERRRPGSARSAFQAAQAASTTASWPPASTRWLSQRSRRYSHTRSTGLSSGL